MDRIRLGLVLIALAAPSSRLAAQDAIDADGSVGYLALGSGLPATILAPEIPAVTAAYEDSAVDAAPPLPEEVAPEVVRTSDEPAVVVLSGEPATPASPALVAATEAPVGQAATIEPIAEVALTEEIVAREAAAKPRNKSRRAKAVQRGMRPAGPSHDDSEAGSLISRALNQPAAALFSSKTANPSTAIGY